MRANQSGQGMTEWVLIVALIAVAAIGVVGVFGDNIRKLIGTSSDSLAGDNIADTGVDKGGNRIQHQNVAAYAGATTFAGAAGTDGRPDAPPAVNPR